MIKHLTNFRLRILQNILLKNFQNKSIDEGSILSIVEDKKNMFNDGDDFFIFTIT